MIGIREKIGYGFGDMASSMFWKLFGSYLMIFYTDVFGMPAAVVGTMFLITRVWDSAFDPIIGIIADRTQSRWGKMCIRDRYIVNGETICFVIVVFHVAWNLIPII